MTITQKRILLTALSVLSLLLLLLFPIKTFAAPTLEATLTPTTAEVTENTEPSTLFSFVLNNTGSENIRCVRITMPTGFEIETINIPSPQYAFNNATNDTNTATYKDLDETSEFEPSMIQEVTISGWATQEGEEVIYITYTAENDCTTDPETDTSQTLTVTTPPPPPPDPEEPTELTQRDYKLIAHITAIGIVGLITYLTANAFRFRL